MDGFGDDFVHPENGVKTEFQEVDPAAEFLAREANAMVGLEDEMFQDNQPAVVNNAYGALKVSETVEIRASLAPSPRPVREEPEKIRIWREQQMLRLAEKDSAEQKAIEELREKARKELEEWYAQHDEQLAKTRLANRSAEKELIADTGRMEPGTEWDRIAKLCDFNPKTAKSSRDISRMRSIILQVKQNPPIKK